MPKASIKHIPHDRMHKEPGAVRAGWAGSRFNAAPAAQLNAQLEWAFSELEEVTRALTLSRQEAQAGRERVQSLTELNSRLNQELIELARREAQVRGFAYHDELTGLPNRRLLLDRLKQAVAQAARQRKQVVLLLIDLDGFKCVNDRLGHAGGDKLLQAVAGRLTDCIRGADTACRYGGDEFLIMLPEVDNPGMAASVRAKLNLALSGPYIIDGYQVRMTVSIGDVVYPTDERTEEALIRRADAALYRAKARSGDAVIEALPRQWLQMDTPCSATSQEPGQGRDAGFRVAARPK
jgi:diguanylate cyclase (GGDEF)-like protein